MITRIKFDTEELQRLGLKTPELRDLSATAAERDLARTKAVVVR